MMTDVLQHFIEKNQDLIDIDLKGFIAKSRWNLTGKDSEALISVLREADIDIESILDTLLVNHLQFVFPTVNPGTSLMEFVSYDLITMHGDRVTYYGKTSTQLANFILENQSKFSDDVSLEKDFQGIYILREPK
jgi:hypothetical protein